MLPPDRSDHRYRLLLRACCERPRRRRAADERDELAPFQLIEVPSIRAGPALVCIELGVSMTAILLKNTLFSKLMSAPNFRLKRD